MRKVFISGNNETRFHSLFEVVPSGGNSARRGVLEPAQLMGLVQWKTPGGLVEVLEESGPMVTKRMLKKVPRIVGIEEAVEIAESAKERGRKSRGFGKIDQSFLHMELYCDGRQGFYCSKASIERAVEEYGLVESDAAADLRAWAKEDSGSKVAIEPLSDVVLMRNICSIALRIVGNYQNPEIEDVLTQSGFKHIERSRKWWVQKGLKPSYYVIPLYHNPAVDRTVILTTPWLNNVLKYQVISPLGVDLYESRPKSSKRGYGSIENADLITAPTVTGKGMPIFNYKYNYDDVDTRYYLGICDDKSQREEAEDFIFGLGKMFMGLRATYERSKEGTGEKLGWDFDEFPPLGVNRFVEPTFETLASAMVGTILYREGRAVTACKYCGNGILASAKGKRREFCSNSCRAAYSNNGGPAVGFDRSVVK